MNLTGNWTASADLVGSAGGRVRCPGYVDSDGIHHRTYVVSSDPAVLDYDALGIGHNEYAVFVDMGLDGRGREYLDVKLAVSDRDHFEGTPAYREQVLKDPVTYRVSKDGKVLQVAASVVTGPSGNHARWPDMGRTGISLTVRCPR